VLKVIAIPGILICGLLLVTCESLSPRGQNSLTSGVLAGEQREELINASGESIESRIICPKGFARTSETEGSFAEFLRELPLKPDNAKVKLFNGASKEKSGVYDAVVDLPIGNKDLHQCADAVMRLRAEYLFKHQQYDEIHFNFTNGFRVDYVEWMKGKRIVVEGNKSYWRQSAEPSDSYQDFWKYLEVIFTYAGTLSLSKELIPVKIEDLEIGDVFIQGGSPGHAIIVVDMATNEQNEIVFLLAQSYMPAQEIQILKNPSNREISPWYGVEADEILETPEWTFKTSDLKRFE